MTKKTCSGCNKEKKVNQFAYDSLENDKLSKYCFECEITQLRKESEKHKGLADKYKADLDVDEFILTAYHKKHTTTASITPKKLANIFKQITKNYMASHHGYIYFIVSEDNQKVKIGFTKDNPANVNEKPVSRIKMICSSCHDNPKIYYYTRGSFKLEKALHNLYEDYKVPKDVGIEWFFIDGDLRLFLNHLKGRQIFLNGSKCIGRPKFK